MSDRRMDGFFYGLFMDVGVLVQNGVTPMNARRAYVDDFRLRIGQRATLVPVAGERSSAAVDSSSSDSPDSRQ